MDFNKPKMVCGVCHGKGGFRKLKKDFLDTNWIDCPYCDGYGFVDDNTTEEECRDDLIQNRYRNKLVLELQMLGDVKVCNLEYVKIVTQDRKRFSQLLKHLMKFSYHSETIKIEIKRTFYLDENEEQADYWEFFIKTNKITDLDGLIEMLGFYNDSVIGGK